MDNPISSHPIASDKAWSPNDMVSEKRDWLDHTFGWWYFLTTPRRIIMNMSFAQRQVERKSRLMSIVTFFYLLEVLLGAPAIPTMTLPILTAYLSMYVMIVFSLVVNKLGKTTLASVMIVLTYEITVAIGILQYNPLDPSKLPTFDLLVVGELMAASLLPVQSIFVATVFNIIFTLLAMANLPPTAEMARAIQQTGLFALSIDQILVFVLVACVVGLWVHYSGKALDRANKAEMVMMLEHEMSIQNEATEKEKRELEDSIQEIVQAHVDTMNGKVQTRIPYPPAKVLWPLVGVINSLWMRLKRSDQEEQTQAELKQAISEYTDFFHQASVAPNQPLLLRRTGTDLDPLVISIKAFQESLQRTTNTSSRPDYEEK